MSSDKAVPCLLMAASKFQLARRQPLKDDLHGKSPQAILHRRALNLCGLVARKGAFHPAKISFPATI